MADALTLPELYYLQDTHIDFAAFDQNGPMDLTGAGKIVVALQRDGIKPFFLQVDSDDVDYNGNSLVTWRSRNEGTGVITVPLSEYPELPIGLIKMQVTAVSSEGQEEFQFMSWSKVRRTIAIV